jgi:tetratricopeptide (TPR) repeat protein
MIDRPLVHRLFSTTLALAVFAAGVVTAAPLGEVVSVQGKGEYRAGGKTDWDLARPKLALESGSSLRTHALSRMKVYLTRAQATKEMDANTTWQIKEEGEGAASTTSLDLLKGKTWGQTKQPPSGLAVRTPGGVAAIRGTQWLIEVDDNGVSTVTVVDGTVDFGNELGQVRISGGEVARGEKGKAPTKQRVVNAAERVQWVSSFRVDTRRYGPVPGVSEDLARSLRVINDEIVAGKGSAAHYLLAADFALYDGNVDAALAQLAEGARRFATDARFAAKRIDAALFGGRFELARQAAGEAEHRHPGSLEAQLAVGDFARLDGDYGRALAAYQGAARNAANDPRGWIGLGKLAAERDDFALARAHFDRAKSLDPSFPGLAGERGNLSVLTRQLGDARQAFGAALQQLPDDYVSYTGLGLAELKAGRTAAAIEALLKATVIEPRYSRAYQYLALAYYQDGRADAALAMLRKASEYDPNDPLPYQLASVMHTDSLRPGEGMRQSLEAMRRLPYLKSVNQVASDQRGSANLGTALAEFGLEGWAEKLAQDSYNPFWAGSHFFLAERSPFRFARESELMQGFLIDPLALGGSNRFQSLAGGPGTYLSATLRHAHSDLSAQTIPSFRINGRVNEPVGVAYMFDVTRNFERADLLQGTGSDERHGTQYVAGIGLQPRHDVSMVLLAGRIESKDDEFRPLDAARVTHRTSKVDQGALGVNYRMAPQSDLSLLFAGSDLTGSERGLYVDSRFVLGPNLSLVSVPDPQTRPYDQTTRLDDAQIGFRTRLAGIDWGLYGQAARRRGQNDLKVNRLLNNNEVFLQSLDRAIRERDEAILLHARYAAPWGLLEAGLEGRRFTYHEDLVFFDQASRRRLEFAERLRASGGRPRAGLVFNVGPQTTFRLAALRWQRPIGDAALGPVTLAGMTIDDRYVYGGGTIDWARGQVEQVLGTHLFASAFVERQRGENLKGDIVGGINQVLGGALAEQIRVRNQTPLAALEASEALAKYARGVIERVGVRANAVLGATTAASAEYVHANSRNTADEFSGKRISYVPRHLATLGLNWYPISHSSLAFKAVYRGTRFRDEPNAVVADAGWSGALRYYIEDAAKNWSLEAQADNLFLRSAPTVFSLVLSARY